MKRTNKPSPRASNEEESGFAAWRKSKQSSQVADALAWRKAYQRAIDEEIASPTVMKILLDGQSKRTSLWKHLVDAEQKPFTSFAAFCAAPLPHGLGTPVDDLRRLRRVLAFNGRD